MLHRINQNLEKEVRVPDDAWQLLRPRKANHVWDEAVVSSSCRHCLLVELQDEPLRNEHYTKKRCSCQDPRQPRGDYSRDLLLGL